MVVRYRPKVRLYWLFLVVAAFAFAAAAMSSRIRYYHGQQRLRSELEALGADVEMASATTDLITRYVLRGTQQTVLRISVSSGDVALVLRTAVDFHANSLEEISITGDQLEYVPHLSTEDVDLLSSLRSLRSLHVAFATISPDALTSMNRLRSLSDLSLFRCGLTDADLARLRLAPQVSELAITYNFITDAGVQDLAKFKGLRKIDADCTAVSNVGADRLEARLPHCIVIARPKDLEGLKRQIALIRDGVFDTLDASGTNIVDSDLIILQNVRGIRGVRMADVWLTGVGLQFLQDPSAIRELSLPRCPLSEDAVHSLARFSHIEVLDLSETPVTTNTLAGLLPKLPLLREVYLTGCHVDEGVIPAFEDLANLEIVTLDGTCISEQAIDALIKRNPDLSVVASPAIE